MGKLLDKIIHGSEDYQLRKKQEKAAKEHAKKKARAAELVAFRQGLIKGAKAKGKREGFAKGAGQGGTLSKIGGVMKSLENSGLGNDVDFGNIGGGLYAGQGSAFGLDFGGGQKKTQKKRVQKKKRKYVVVNGKKYYQG